MEHTHQYYYLVYPACSNAAIFPIRSLFLSSQHFCVSTKMKEILTAQTICINKCTHACQKTPKLDFSPLFSNVTFHLFIIHHPHPTTLHQLEVWAQTVLNQDGAVHWAVWLQIQF